MAVLLVALLSHRTLLLYSFRSHYVHGRCDKHRRANWPECPPIYRRHADPWQLWAVGHNSLRHSVMTSATASNQLDTGQDQITCNLTLSRQNSCGVSHRAVNINCLKTYWSAIIAWNQSVCQRLRSVSGHRYVDGLAHNLSVPVWHPDAVMLHTSLATTFIVRNTDHGVHSVPRWLL